MNKKFIRGTKQQRPKTKMNNLVRFRLFWAILVFGILEFIAVTSTQSYLKNVQISSVISSANAGEVKKLEVQGTYVKVTLNSQDKPTEKSIIQAGVSLKDQGLRGDAKVEVEYVEPSQTSATRWNLALIIGPVLLLGGLFVFMMSQARGQHHPALGCGKSKDQLYDLDKEIVVFEVMAVHLCAK